MNVQIGKWGDGLGVRLPVGMGRELGLREGSELDLQNQDGQLVLRPIPPPKRSYSLDALLAEIQPDHVHEPTAWGTPEGQESW
jgi:antitoxin MazE